MNGRGAAAPRNMGAAAGTGTWKSDDGTVEIVSTELLFCDATDLTADLLAIAGPAGAGFTTRGGRDRIDAVAALAREVVGGRLTSYLTRILANTTLIVRGDGAGTYPLNTKDALNKAFTGRQKYVFPAVSLAMEVSLVGFLDGLALIGFDLRGMMTTTVESPSEDSSQSTSATG